MMEILKNHGSKIYRVEYLGIYALQVFLSPYVQRPGLAASAYLNSYLEGSLAFSLFDII